MLLANFNQKSTNQQVMKLGMSQQNTSILLSKIPEQETLVSWVVCLSSLTWLSNTHQSKGKASSISNYNTGLKWLVLCDLCYGKTQIRMKTDTSSVENMARRTAVLSLSIPISRNLLHTNVPRAKNICHLALQCWANVLEWVSQQNVEFDRKEAVNCRCWEPRHALHTTGGLFQPPR